VQEGQENGCSWYGAQGRIPLVGKAKAGKSSGPKNGLPPKPSRRWQHAGDASRKLLREHPVEGPILCRQTSPRIIHLHPSVT